MSDDVFRGVSQSDNDPAIQGGIDFAWGILYAGAWASLVDFAGLGLLARRDAREVDWYGGIKPTWNLAAFRHDGELDFGCDLLFVSGSNVAPRWPTSTTSS